jgi:hypothetical protein
MVLMELILIGKYSSCFLSIGNDLLLLREYPVSGGLAGNTVRPEDKQNYVLLLKEIRQQLDTVGIVSGKTYLLTVA